MTDKTTRNIVLNDVIVRTLAIPAEGVVQYADGKIAGMGVRVTAAGAKSFYLAYRHGGKPYRLNLGRYPVTTLAKARARAHAALVELSEGRNPKAPPEGEGATFAETMIEFVEQHCRRHNRASTAAETERLLRTCFLPLWETRGVDTLTRGDVVAALEVILKRGRPMAARHAFAAVRKFFNWMVEQGRMEISPCAGMKPPSKAGTRDRVLTDDELRAIWKAAEVVGWPFGRIVQILMLTAQRRTEVSAMQWQEVNIDRAVWTIPAERSKNNKPHAVPLCPAVSSLIERLPRFTSEFVFPARGMPEQAYTGWSKGKRMLDAEAGLHDWTLHDLRRTAATGMARAGVAPHVVERVLNHVSGTFAGVAGIYNRFQYSDEMRAALEAWERHVLAVVGGGGAVKTDTAAHSTT